jgi:hypothetical protein
MKNRIISQILTVTLFSAAPAFAQDAPRYTHLDEAEPAPFAGTLFNPSATAQLLADNQYSFEECDLRVEYEIARTTANMQFQIDSLQISYDSLDERHNLLMDIKNDEIDTYRELALEQPNKNNHWWMAGGVVAGIGLTLGTLFAASEIMK